MGERMVAKGGIFIDIQVYIYIYKPYVYTLRCILCIYDMINSIVLHFNIYYINQRISEHHIYIYIYTHVIVYIYICISIYTLYIYIHIYIHVYIYIYN